jgi:hypothetical protein
MRPFFNLVALTGLKHLDALIIERVDQRSTNSVLFRSCSIPVMRVHGAHVSLKYNIC